MSVEKMVILTYEDLYGSKVKMSEIIDKIRSLDIRAISDAAYIIANKGKLRNEFIGAYFRRTVSKRIESIPSVNDRIKLMVKLKSENCVLVSLQGMLNTIKHVYCYSGCLSSDINLEDFDVDEDRIAEIIDIQLMLSDYMQTEIEDSDLLLYSMIKFNLGVNLKNLLARTWYVYCVLSIDKSKIGITDKQNITFNQDYINEFEYSIEDFLSVNFYMFNQFVSSDSYNPLIDIESHFIKANNSKACSKMLSDLQCTAAEFKEVSLESIENTWDYELLAKKPFLQVAGNNVVVPSDIHLQAFLLNNLRQRVQNLYSSTGNEFAQFLGYPFETYVQELCETSIANTNYQGLKEFYIRNGLKSNEYYIRKNEKLMIIEVKAKDIDREKLFCRLDPDIIKGIVTDQFVKPIKQIDKRYNDILNSKHSVLFESIEEIIAIAVTFENTHLSVPAYHQYAVSQLNEGEFKLTRDEIKSYFNFSIEEFECICWMFENGIDVFDLLNQYYPISNQIPLFNFLSIIGIDNQVNPLKVNEIWASLTNKFFEFLL